MVCPKFGEHPPSNTATHSSSIQCLRMSSGIFNVRGQADLGGTLSYLFGMRCTSIHKNGAAMQASDIQAGSREKVLVNKPVLPQLA